jgi:hypothetical protein
MVVTCQWSFTLRLSAAETMSPMRRGFKEPYIAVGPHGTRMHAAWTILHGPALFEVTFCGRQTSASKE